jgi:hypothetical protein
MARPTVHESVKWCNEKVLLGKLAIWSTVSELQPLEDKEIFEVSPSECNAVCCVSVQWLPDMLDSYRWYVKSIQYLFLQVLDLSNIYCINSDFRCFRGKYVSRLHQVKEQAVFLVHFFLLLLWKQTAQSVLEL